MIDAYSINLHALKYSNIRKKVHIPKLLILHLITDYKYQT